MVWRMRMTDDFQEERENGEEALGEHIVKRKRFRESACAEKTKRRGEIRVKADRT